MMLPLLVFGPMVCAPICYALGKGSKPLRAALMAAVGVLAFAGCLTLWGRATPFALTASAACTPRGRRSCG